MTGIAGKRRAHPRSNTGRSGRGGGPTGERIRNSTRGAMAGIAATLPMSAVFAAARGVGALDELPPHRAVRRVGPPAREASRRVVATVLHLGIGGVSGAVYGLLGGAARRTAGDAAAHGTLHALATWAFGYLIVLPRAGVLPPAHRDHRARARWIVAAHLVFGVALGLLCRRRE